jgi:SAM-dependent methyltransferase
VTLKQQVGRRMIGQFMHPRGLGGQLSGWVMAHRGSNRRRNTWVVSLLDVQPTDRVLEIGFGPGIAIGELARRTTEGVVIGVDQSEVMVRLARKRNVAAVHRGKVDLRLGSVEALPDLGGALDKILSVNSMGSGPIRWSDCASSGAGCAPEESSRSRRSLGVRARPARHPHGQPARSIRRSASPASRGPTSSDSSSTLR